MAFALEELSGITDAELVCRLEGLVEADRMLSSKLLVHLGELHERKLYLGRGYGSIFEYCRSGLGMSEAEAYLRIYAAKVGRRFPVVLERLGSGAVHLTGIKLLGPHLTEGNHVQLLDRVKGMTKRQIEMLVAEIAPKPDVSARLRKLPVASVPPEGLLLPLSEPADPAPMPQPPQVVAAPQTPSAAAECSPTFALQSPRARACTTPLRPGRFKLELTLGQDGHDSLEQLRELLRHQNPSGDLTSIVERALRELLEREMKRRFARTSTPQQRVRSRPNAQGKSKASSRKSRYIPREVLREVYARDSGQCTFVSREGRRCSARGFLEVHHHTTFARGGAATADNLRLACREHNFFLGEQDYGREFMQRKLREAVAQRNVSGNSVQNESVERS